MKWTSYHTGLVVFFALNMISAILYKGCAFFQAYDISKQTATPQQMLSMTKPQNPQAQIGKHIFLDTTLSNPQGQACASCHQAEYAFAEPRALPVGAIETRTGKRNTPSLLYAAYIPEPTFLSASPVLESDEAGMVGGLFWDGRARTLEEQAIEPFFNPDEMNLSGPEELASRLRRADYSSFLKKVAGEDIWRDDMKLVSFAAQSIAHFLREPLFSPFDAPVDRYIAGDTTALSNQQIRGMNLFMSSYLQCNECHSFEGTVDYQPLFTDYSFANLGLANRFDDIDLGLFIVTQDELQKNRFRTPSLRNVALTAPYMHDGSLETIEDVLDFYNTRDIDPERWGSPAVLLGMHRKRIGNMNLSSADIADLAAFLEALTDDVWYSAAQESRTTQRAILDARNKEQAYQILDFYAD